MTYAPLNINVYDLAFQGAQAGALASQRTNTTGTVSTYTPYSTVAQVWAQAFDIAWNSNLKIDEVQATGIFGASYGFWSGNTAIGFFSGITLAQCTSYILPIIASIQSSEQNFAAEGIVPQLWGGSSGSYTTTSGTFVQPAINGTVSVPVLLSNWMVVGEVIFIATGGYYKVYSITNSTNVIVQNLGYTGNATPGTSIQAGNGVGASGLQGIPGSSVAGLSNMEILFGSSAGALQQSLGLTWNDSIQTLTIGGAGTYGPLGTVVITPWTYTPILASGVSYQFQPATVAAGAYGTGVYHNAGNSTTLTGGTYAITGGAGGTGGGGGVVQITGGAGGNGGTVANIGGSVGLKGGNTTSSTAIAGSVVLQPGGGAAVINNGAIKLYDATGALAFQVINGNNLLDAPLTGDENTNNPLCFGVASVAFPVGSIGETVLSNAQYNKFCIRMSGAATSGGLAVIVFPDVAGGYTKVLDLTQVSNLPNLGVLSIWAGGGGGSKVFNIPGGVIPTTYIVNYDGTTITCSSSPSGKGAGTIVNSFQATTNTWQTIANAAITVGQSGMIVSSFSAYATIVAAGTIETRLAFNGNAVGTSTLVQTVSFSTGGQSMNSTYPFTGLTAGTNYTVSAQVFGTTAYAWNNASLTLLSP
jgi:hypothetical protein